MSDKVVALHGSNKVLERLDENIMAAIKEIAEEHNLTASEIVGVFRCIEFRLFFGD